MAERDTTATAGTAYEATAVAAASAQHGEPTWLTEARTEAARAFAALPMPTPALRPWKYTDLAGVAIDASAPDVAFAPRVEGTAPASGFAGSIADALANPALAATVRAHLGSMVHATEGKFTAANAAMWSQGALVVGPRGGAFAAPVRITLDGAGGAIFPRLLVVAEPASEVTILVRSRSDEQPLLVAGVIEIVAQPDSRVRLMIDTRWGTATREITTLRTRIHKGADVQIGTIGLSGGLVKQTVEALMEGEGSNSVIRGVAVGDGDEHFDFVTLQDLIGPKSTSEVEVKTALAGASKSVYYGVTRVETSASGAGANQENRNLLLSDRAKADADPVLEILTNDVVRCGHGATVGPVDREALFYLQSRGLDRRAALTLMVTAFLESVVSSLGAEGLIDDLSEAVTAKLANARL